RTRASTSSPGSCSRTTRRSGAGSRGWRPSTGRRSRRTTRSRACARLADAWSLKPNRSIPSALVIPMHGAGIVTGPTDFEYGERGYTAHGFAGHEWTFSETLADVGPADWGGQLVAT